MDGLSTKDLVGVILGIIFLVMIVFARGSSSRRQPKDKFFSCWRCKKLTPHNRRTIEAWRNDKSHFFCGVCHTQWLQSHPAPVVQRSRSSPVASFVLFAAFIAISLFVRSCS